MPPRPPSNSARKIAARPVDADAATTTLPTEERRTIAPELLLDSTLALEKYKVPILLGLTLLVLAAVGFGYYQSYQARNAAAASALLDSAKTDADYQKVIDIYPGSNAAANATLLLGRAKYNAKDYAGAAQVWGSFAAKFPQHSLAPDALIGQAGALEAQGKLDEARATYQRAATSYQSSYAAPLARISEATLLLAQRKTDEAKHVYEDVIASSPKSDASQMAEQGLRTLNALPPLGGSAAVSASTAPAVSPEPVPAVTASPVAVAVPGAPEPSASVSPVVVAPPPEVAPSAIASPAIVVPRPVVEPTVPTAEAPSVPAATVAPAESPAATPQATPK